MHARGVAVMKTLDELAGLGHAQDDYSRRMCVCQQYNVSQYKVKNWIG